MIVLSPLLKKQSFLFTEEQKDIVVALLNDYFRLELPNSNGAYLATFDFSKINFYFCKSFLYNFNSSIQGAWTPLFFDSVFVIPTFWNKAMVQDFKQNLIYKKYNLNQYDNNSNFYRAVLPENATDNQLDIISLWNNYNSDLYFYNKGNKYDIYKASYISNIKLYNFLYNFLQNSTIITLLHQLYHKYQFSAAWYMPIIYMANYLLSLCFGYKNASNTPFTIQGNVRVVVDNENTEKIVEKLLKIFESLGQIYKFLSYNSKQEYIKSYIDEAQVEEKQSKKRQLEENAIKYYEYYTKQCIDIYDSKQAKVLFKIFKKYNIIKRQFIQKIQNFIKNNK